MMKFILAFFLVFCPLRVSAQNTNVSSTDGKHLLLSMQAFFFETLQNNYHCNDKYHCYEQFLLEVSSNCKDVKNPHNKRWVCDLEINKQKITTINKILFIRDHCHYYYFYPEIVNYRVNHNAIPYNQKWHSILQAYASIPFILSSEDRNFTSNDAVVRLNTFHNCFMEDYFETELLDLMKYTSGEINFCYFAMAGYSKIRETQKLSEELEIQIVVIFWKLLCQNASIDFHKPLTTQPWEEELNAIVGE